MTKPVLPLVKASNLWMTSVFLNSQLTFPAEWIANHLGSTTRIAA
jgi:hypothetical protein